jgi:hypothetical protein
LEFSAIRGKKEKFFTVTQKADAKELVSSEWNNSFVAPFASEHVCGSREEERGRKIVLFFIH